VKLGLNQFYFAVFVQKR